MKKNLYRMILVAACAVAMGGWMVSRAVAADPVKIHLDHWKNGGTPQTASGWVDGNLHKTNSTYTEGDTIPTRFVLDNLPTGTYTLTFRWLAAKHQALEIKHAHDYLQTFNAGAAAGYNVFNNPAGATVDPCLPRVQGSSGNICALGSFANGSGLYASVTIPADTVGLFTGVGWVGPDGSKPSGQEFRMVSNPASNVTINSIGIPPYIYDPSSGTLFGEANKDYHNRISINFTVSGSTSDVVLALGAHMAVADDWDSLVTDLTTDTEDDDNGSCNINGAPYHWDYELISNSATLQSGSRDRSIMCQGTEPTGLISVNKICHVGGETGFDLVDPDTVFDFTGTDPLPTEFELSCGGAAVEAIVPAGFNDPVTITESGLAFGWGIYNISCSGTNKNGEALPASSFRYLGKLGGTDAFELGDYYVEIDYHAGDNVSCTFTNGQAEMPLNKLINGEQAVCTPVLVEGQPVFDAFGNQVFERPCHYPIDGLELEDNSDTRFTFDLYLTDPNTQRPTTLPNPPWNGFPSPALASALVPPLFEAPGLIGVPLTLCEEPAPGFFLTSVQVIITPGLNPDPNLDGDNDPTTFSVPLYSLVLGALVNGQVLLPVPTAHTFPAGTYRCFNILLPNGTTRFEINANNQRVARTVTQGGWGAPPNGGNPGTILDANACTLLPTAIGNGVSPYSLSGHPTGTVPRIRFSFTTSCSTTKGQSIRNYLKWTTGTPNKLGATTDLLFSGTPVCTTSKSGPTTGDCNAAHRTAGGAGIFGAQTLALYLNIWMGDHGVFAPFGSIGGFTVHCDGACDAADAADAVLASVNGLTVEQILNIANNVLGGAAPPAGYTVATFNQLVDFLNNAFQNGVPSAWALAHLF